MIEWVVAFIFGFIIICVSWIAYRIATVGYIAIKTRGVSVVCLYRLWKENGFTRAMSISNDIESDFFNAILEDGTVKCRACGLPGVMYCTWCRYVFNPTRRRVLIYLCIKRAYPHVPRDVIKLICMQSMR